MSAISVGRVNTLRREIVQFLKISIPGKGSENRTRGIGKRNDVHDDLLFVCVFEGFGPLYRVLALRAYTCASAQPGNVSSHY